MKRIHLFITIACLTAFPSFAASGPTTNTTGPVVDFRSAQDVRAFLNCQLGPTLGNAWDYTFAPGELPAIQWDRSELVEKYWGSFPIKARWFDGEGREVTSADHPGRYGFCAEGRTSNGLTIRRGGTLFCRPKNWDGWNERLKADLDFIPLDGLTQAAWKEHRSAIADYAGRTVLLSILRQREGAILMCYLHELRSSGIRPALTDAPLIRDHEYHLALKRKILGIGTIAWVTGSSQVFGPGPATFRRQHGRRVRRTPGDRLLEPSSTSGRVASIPAGS